MHRTLARAAWLYPLTATATVTATLLAHLTPSSAKSDASSGVAGAVIVTPLVHLSSLSQETGCNIYAKCEFMNPSGSVKDRAAINLIREAEENGTLKKGGTIVEGTGGNTGIALAQLGGAKGYKVVLCMPENISQEKIDHMRRLGAEVHVQPLAPFSSPVHYAQLAAVIAKERGGFYVNQFENLANFRAHYGSTGPEIWRQSGQRVDVFIASAGTGGTLAGISSYLQVVQPGVKCLLADPHSSSLFDFVKSGGVSLEASAGSTVAEGIGIGRITANFGAAKLDDAIKICDQEAVEMAYYLLRNEGLFVGPSAALNVAGAVKAALRLKKQREAQEHEEGETSVPTIVTILCDGGDRYQSKMYSPKWLEEKQLTPKSTGRSLDFITAEDS